MEEIQDSTRTLKDGILDPKRTLKEEIQDHSDTPYPACESITPYPACQETPGEEDNGRPPELYESSDDGDDGDENDLRDHGEESGSEDDGFRMIVEPIQDQPRWLFSKDNMIHHN